MAISVQNYSLYTERNMQWNKKQIFGGGGGNEIRVESIDYNIDSEVYRNSTLLFLLLFNINNVRVRQKVIKKHNYHALDLVCVCMAC